MMSKADADFYMQRIHATTRARVVILKPIKEDRDGYELVVTSPNGDRQFLFQDAADWDKVKQYELSNEELRAEANRINDGQSSSVSTSETVDAIFESAEQVEQLELF